MALNHIQASDLVHTKIGSVLTPTDFRHAWAIFGPLGDKNTRARAIFGPLVIHMFQT